MSLTRNDYRLDWEFLDDLSSWYSSYLYRVYIKYTSLSADFAPSLAPEQQRNSRTVLFQ